MSIVPTSPTLSYVSSVDVTSIVNDGLTKYQILFDASLVTLGNLIMFEYKFQIYGQTQANLTNTSFGFISVDDAIQSGIENQYVIAVPASANTLNGLATETIQVRVYSGIAASANNVVVTPWSNALSVYNPPVTPVIYTDSAGNHGAYYDPTFNTDYLYVLLNPAQNDYDYTKMKFVVCYFYQDQSLNTVWNVSEPLSATLTTFGSQQFRLITVPNIGTVSTATGYQKVYVSIHAVYDWVSNSNNYYAVSYMSNEVIAVSASADAQPDITDISYNVYNAPFPVPGVQTMTITWTAPGNSSLPFYQVLNYKLYYQKSSDGTNYDPPVEYTDVSGTTLSATVNVGSTGLNPLNLSCGQSIKYRVDAITVNSAVESSPVSSATNFFKYSEAVTNLTITNTSYSGQLVGMTVNFTGLNDTTKGCGAGLQYVVSIDGNTTFVPVGGLASLAYSANTNYSLVYTGLSVAQVGNVVVYLQTNNTNASPASPLNGAPATVPYIANSFVLDTVNYEVYAFGNLDQDMVLTWASPALTGWSVTNYNVQLSVNSAIFTTIATTTNTTYTYDASLNASSVNNLAFKIIANLTNTTTTPSTNYALPSNSEAKNTFKYAENVSNPKVDWSVSNTANTTMDIQYRFQNPSVEGTNYGLQYFIVEVKNSSDTVISSQQITYVSGSGTYTVNFDNITPYSASGSVVTTPYVLDTNGGGIISKNIYATSTGYTTGGVPLFKNIVSTSNHIEGEILSNDPLKLVGNVTYPNLSNVLVTETYIANTSGVIPGIVLTETVLSTGIYYYTFDITVSVFFPSGGYIPPRCIISASNNAGIGNSDNINIVP
jgi:hypothetical protein